VIEVDVREKDAVDGADAEFIQPLNEVRDGGGRAGIDKERDPVNPVYPGADELAETLQGPVKVNQVQIVMYVMNGHRLSFWKFYVSV
jgi:hypothetical protein